MMDQTQPYPNTNRSVLAASSGFRFSSKCP